MNLADRLRSVVGSGGSAARPSTDARGALSDVEGRNRPYVLPVRRPGAAEPARVSADPANITRVAEILGGEYREWYGHPYVVIERKYPPGHRHGRTSVADNAPGQNGCWPALSLLEPAFAGRRQVLFIDLETTGLAGGAGTYAFLIGCGWFDGATFRVRQFLLAGFGAERGLLEQVAETAAGADAVASYNGKTFDLPLIETRFVLHRMATPFEGMPHIDMLHLARRLWRSASGADSSRPPREPERLAPRATGATCRLTAIEEAVLGHVREGDVPGFEIPSRYFHYVRSGDLRPLEAVIEHNRLDLLSLAMLTARAAQLLEHGAAGAATAREALGLGRLYQRGNMAAQARACFARAAGMDAGADLAGGPHTDHVNTRAEALHAYAVLCRRDRQYDHAADGWCRLLELQTCPPHFAHEAVEALAVHHEHRLRDFHRAREFALQALQFDATIARRQAVHHRLARLDRKLACPAEPREADVQKRRRKYAGPRFATRDPAPLF